MARVRPTEAKAVQAILLGSVPDLTEDDKAEAYDMAVEILAVVDELREKRPDWFIVKVDPGVAVTLHGPYLTRNAAKKEIERGDLIAASKSATALILQRISSVYEGVEQ